MVHKSTLKEQTVNGVKWQVAASFISKIISFGTTIVLARILGPANYGLFALAFVIIGSFGLFKSLGIESALIQRKNGIEKAANTAFFIIPTLGIFLYLLLYASAPFIASFLNNKELISVLRVLGIIFVLWSLSRVPLSLLEKEMRFAKISISEIIGTILFSVTAIALAKLHFGVWCLIYGQLINTITFTILLWTFCSWRPKFEFDRKVAFEMSNFGIFIFLTGMIWFLKMNLDNVLVGKFLGTEKLGLYAIAFNISNFGSDYFSNKVYRVTYPAYAKLQENKENLKAAFLNVFSHICFFVFPLGLGIFLLGDDFIKIAYGDKWLEAIMSLRILTCCGVFNAIITSNDAILLAVGKSKVNFFVYLIQVVMFFSLIAPFSFSFGLKGVSIVVTSASFVAMIYSFLWVIKILDLKIREIIHNLVNTIISLVLAVIPILFLENSLPFITAFPNELYRFSILLIIFIALYFLVTIKINKKLLTEMKKFLVD